MGTSLNKELLQSIQPKLSDNVEKLEFQSGLDSEGEPATWIWVVLKADAPAEAWSWEAKQEIRSRLKDELEKKNVSDWVYIRFRSADEDAPSTAVSST